MIVDGETVAAASGYMPWWSDGDLVYDGCHPAGSTVEVFNPSAHCGRAEAAGHLELAVEHQSAPGSAWAAKAILLPVCDGDAFAPR